MILRSSIKVEEIEDPIKPVEALVGRIDRQELLDLYEFEKDFESVDELLGHVSRKKGLLKHGGVPNFDQAARRVIRDYLDGKIKFFTPAPHHEGDDEDESNV